MKLMEIIKLKFIVVILSTTFFSLKLTGQVFPVNFCWIQNENHGLDTEKWKEWLIQKSKIQKPFKWVQISSIPTIAGGHLKYQLHLHDLPVIGAQANIMVKNNGKGLAASFPQIPDLNIDKPSIYSDSWIYISEKFSECKTRDERKQTDFGLFWHRYWEDSQGNELYNQNMLSHYSDSIGLVSIFNPDPLTKAGVVYGSPYIDANDQNLSVLQPLQDSASLDLTYSGSTFLLKNSAAEISEFDPPSRTIPQSMNGNFIFSRTDPGFEMTNALYHISKMKDRIDSLGYNHLVNYSIPVDVNAMNGSDNSAFDPGTTPPSLLFGEGGVDDAEDADVIIHEYSHAISHSASPNTLFGTERQCLDEALGDYFASSYSRNLNYFNWQKVFSWDGHNEFWNGRSAVNTEMKMYPNVTFSGIYEHTDLFVDPLMRLWINHGSNTVDNLVLESIHNWTSGMTFPVAANWILAADSALYGGIHSSDIHLQFARWNILTPKANQKESTDVKKPKDLHIHTIWMIPTDLQGKRAEIFSSSALRVWSGELPESIDMGSWKSGIYYLRNSNEISKILLQK